MEVPAIKFECGKSNAISKKAFAAIAQWLKFADKHFTEWNGRPNCGYFFSGAYWYGFETSNTAFVYAVAARFAEYEPNITIMPRDRIYERAIKAIRYLAFTHDTGPEECVRVESSNPYCSKTKWGGRNDGFFRATQCGNSVYAFGLAAWLLWDKLDDETKTLVYQVVSDFAGRWSREEPRNGVYYDTMTEENAWTAKGISIAAKMFASHPDVEIWKRGVERWAINTCTTYLDRLGGNTSISTITTHPDYTTENHGFVHPDYMACGIELRSHIALLSLMTDDQIPPYTYYHWDDVYAKALKVWSESDGSIVPVQGQDWWYKRQVFWQYIHASMKIIRGDADAACLELSALDSVLGFQKDNGNGCLYEANGDEYRLNDTQTVNDMEHQAAIYIASTYLLNYFGGYGECEEDYHKLREKLIGTYCYPYGNSIVHRTVNSFSSFSWRNNVMGLTLPQNGNWTITALPSSYCGIVALEGLGGGIDFFSNHAIHHILDEKISVKSDGFAVTGRIDRGNHALFQHIAFVSLPEGTTVYFECFQAEDDCTIQELKTGLIGIRNESCSSKGSLAKGYRDIYLEGGEKYKFDGFYGKEQDRIVHWDHIHHINIDNEIGYVLVNSMGVEYCNRHRYPKWKGIEDIMVLNRGSNIQLKKGKASDPFIAISMPNQNSAQTRMISQSLQVLESFDAQINALILGNKLVFCNFLNNSTLISGKNNIKSKRIHLFRGLNILNNGIYKWFGEAGEREAGWLESNFMLESDEICELSIEADISLNGRIVLKNNLDKTVCADIIMIPSNSRKTITIGPHECITCSYQ